MRRIASAAIYFFCTLAFLAPQYSFALDPPSIKIESPLEELKIALGQNPFLTEDFLEGIFSDPRMFSTEEYRHDTCTNFLEQYTDEFKLLGSKSIQIGAEYFFQNKEMFTAAEKTYGVPAEYIIAILRKETYFGVCTGMYLVLPRLYFLYSHNPSRKEFARREIEAFLELAREYSWQPFEIRGSSMGAIGIAQFIPSSIKNFAVDGNGDGTIDMQDPRDAIPSIAHYLAINHFRRSKRASIWNYNRNLEYVRQVLTYAARIKRKIAAHTQ